MNKMKPIENKDLIQSIENLKSNPNKITENLFFEQLKNAKFILPVKFNKDPKLDKDNNYVLDKDVLIDLVLIKDEEGNSYFPAFLDFDSFKKWDMSKNFSNIVIDYQGFNNFFNSAENNAKGVAVDPFGLNIICSKQLIKDLAENNINKIDSNEKPIITEPKIYPTSMVNTLYEYFKKTGIINKAYLKSLVYPNKIQFLIILDGVENETVFNTLREIASPHSKGIEIIFKDINASIAKESIDEKDIPFFER